MAYTGKKPIDHTDVTQSQSMTVTDDLTVDTNTLFVDSTNNRVGVGTSPAQPFHVKGGAVQFENTQNTYLQINTADTHLYTAGAHPLRFGTNSTERMRIDSSGNVAIGATSTSNKLEVRGVGLFSSDGNYRATNSGVLNVSPNGNLAIGFGGDTDANYYAAIFHNSSNTAVGSIFVNATSTTYATSSDYRLKENVTGITDGITRVKQLNPSRFNFIADPDTTVDGFLAHEAQTVVPEAITGEKDAMRDEEYEVTPAVFDDDGNVVTEAVMGTRSVPDYQGIDQAKLVPLLAAALQEAIAKIETLETKVTALEAE
jgi:hypothetical protein